MVQVRACFRWQGEGASGVLRLEVSLFSGFEVEHVALIRGSDGKIVDFLHDKRGEKIWFLFDSVLPGCALCARFTARGRYSVRSLRPASARVFPAGRAHLAAHAFFHAPRRNQSSLLAGVTDDDLITWFGKQVVDTAGAAEVPLGSDFSDMCECGDHVCSGVITGGNAHPTEYSHTESPKNLVNSSSTSPATMTSATTTAAAFTHPTTLPSDQRATTTAPRKEQPVTVSTPKVDIDIQQEIKSTVIPPKVLSRNRNREEYRISPDHGKEDLDQDDGESVVVSLETPAVKQYTTPGDTSPTTVHLTSTPTSQSIILSSTVGPTAKTTRHVEKAPSTTTESSKNSTTTHRKVTARELGITTASGTEPPGSTTTPQSPTAAPVTVDASLPDISAKSTTVAETSTAAFATTVDPTIVRTGSTAKKWPKGPRMRLPETRPKPTVTPVKQNEGRMVVLNGNSLYGLLKGSAKPDLHGRPVKGKGQDD